jgi:molybdopterin-guanine dinucleotide biosynthesis protein A
VRRRGWGRRALAAWLERARGAGATVAHLEVARGNGAAAGLYRAAGFRCVGLRSAYYADGDDALIFSKSPLPGADDPEAFILAGGRARRLGGRAKPLVRRRDGRTLLEALVASLQPFTRRIWLCAPPSVAAGLRVAEPIAAGLPLASDDGRGPGRAVQRALERSESDRVLWTVADWARPHPDLWSALLDGLDSADAAVVEAGGRRQVGAVVARRSALPPAPTSSLQGLLRGVDVRAIAERSLSAAARAALFDIDEPGDLRVADPILAPGDERPEDPGNAA